MNTDNKQKVIFLDFDGVITTMRSVLVQEGGGSGRGILQMSEETDLQTIKKIFDRVGIKYEERSETLKFHAPIYGVKTIWEEKSRDTIYLLVEAGDLGFYSCLSFDKDGVLLAVEACE